MEANVVDITLALSRTDINIVWYLLVNSALAYLVNLTNFLVTKHTSARLCSRTSTQNPSLLQIEGVNTKEEVAWYAGKRLAYIYKAKTETNDTHYRSIWGKVTRPHGNSGVVRAKFKSNLPPKSMGAKVRIFMYPSNT